jgi:hypothetical protein
MSFADTVKQAVESIEKEPKSTPAQAFLEVLHELARGLGQAGVGAEIRPWRDPRKSSLYLFPPHRPSMGSHLLMFSLAEGAILVSGETPTLLRTPNDLEAWLLGFIKLPAFVESLSILRERASEPVEARLCEFKAPRVSRSDVLVQVKPEDQVRIDAAGDASIVVDVAREEFPGNAPLDSALEYSLLDSAGLLVNVTKIDVRGDFATITGTRIAR